MATRSYAVRKVQDARFRSVESMGFGSPHFPDLQWGHSQQLRDFFKILQKDAYSTASGIGQIPVKRQERVFYKLFSQYLPL